MIKKVLILASIPLIGLSLVRPAAAFNLGDIADAAGDMAPNIAETIGLDIAPYQKIIERSSAFGKAVLTGNYPAALKPIMGALGDYGIIAPSKLKETVAQQSSQRYQKGQDYGGGWQELSDADLMDAIEMTDATQNEIALSPEAQTAMVKSADASAQAVQASAQYSKLSGQTKISQKIFRNISGQLNINANLTGQSLSEQRETNNMLRKTNALLSDIRAARNKDTRKDTATANRSTHGAIGAAGMFAANITPQQREDATYGNVQ